MKKCLNELSKVLGITKRQIDELKLYSNETGINYSINDNEFFEKQIFPSVDQNKHLPNKGFAFEHINIFSEKYSFRYEINLMRRVLLECMLDELKHLKSYLRAASNIHRGIAKYPEPDPVSSGYDHDIERYMSLHSGILSDIGGAASYKYSAESGIQRLAVKIMRVAADVLSRLKEYAVALSKVFGPVTHIYGQPAEHAGSMAVYCRLAPEYKRYISADDRKYPVHTQVQSADVRRSPGILRVMSADSGEIVYTMKNINFKNVLNY